MKKLFYFTQVLLLCITAMLTVSCSHSDSDDASKLHIKSVTAGNSVTEYEYDAAGRIIKLNEIYGGRSTPDITHYIYMDDKIVISDEDSAGSEAYTYKLSNGLITDLDEKLFYNYNGGYLSTVRDSYMMDASADDATFTWSNGNLVLVEESGVFQKYEISYSNIPWPANFLPSLVFDILYFPLDEDDCILWYSGYFGGKPRNLPSKIVRNDSDETVFDYDVEGGLVKRVVISNTMLSSVVYELTYE